MANIKIKTTTGKNVEISEQSLIEAMYAFASFNWEKKRSEIYIEGPGERNFAIVPTNLNKI